MAASGNRWLDFKIFYAQSFFLTIKKAFNF